jgi:hypothetical protein
MSFVHGKDSYFKLGTTELTSYLDGVDLNRTADTAESSTMGNEAKTYVSALTDTTLSLSGKYDSTLIVNEVQTLDVTGTVDGGQYKLSFDGQTTSDLDYDDDAATIETALEALSNIASGDVAVTGGDLPDDPIVITFGGVYAGTDVPLITVAAGTSPLTGGGSYAVTLTTAGTAGPDAVLNSYVGSENATAFIFGPEGNGSGDVRYSGSAYVTSYNMTAPVGDVVAFTADLQVTGEVTKDTF